MATINQNDLRIKNAKNLIDSFNSPDGGALSYVFMGRVQPWEQENSPPQPQNNYQTFYNTYDNLFAMKRIMNSDVYSMIPKISWVSGTVYDYYRQDYSTERRSFTGASNLYDCKWVIRNSLNVVYVCLNNNGNTPSTVEPLNTSNEAFETSDGYQWQRVYTITAGVYNTYGTDDFMPIQNNDVVSVTDGAISTVIVENPGADFTNTPAGSQTQVPYYYCNIDGDGVGAVARVRVVFGSAISVEVVRPGSGYTFATLNFTADNSYASLSDLDTDTSPLNPAGDGTFSSTVIIPPPGGWGSDLVRQLGATRVGVFSSLNFDLFNFFTGSFRQVGILQDMTVSQTNPTSVNACYAVQIDKNNILPGKIYASGETITQVVTDSDNQSHIAKGTVIAYDSASGVIRYSQDSSNVDADDTLYRFGGSAKITGLTTGLSASPTDYTGDLTDIPFIGGYSVPQVTAYSGYMTYLANVSPVVRDEQQTERISLVIAF